MSKKITITITILVVICLGGEMEHSTPLPSPQYVSGLQQVKQSLAAMGKEALAKGFPKETLKFMQQLDPMTEFNLLQGVILAYLRANARASALTKAASLGVSPSEQSRKEEISVLSLSGKCIEAIRKDDSHVIERECTDLSMCRLAI